MKIVSWQAVLTEHQVHTFRELQKLEDEPLEFIVGERELAARTNQGWMACDLSGLSVHDLPRRGWWCLGVEMIRRFPDALHLFNGMWGDRRLFLLLVYAQIKGLRTGLITEPYADKAVSYFGTRPSIYDRIKSAIRPAAYRILGGMVARRMSIVFAISAKAVAQFKSIGVRSERVMPYGYFVPLEAATTLQDAHRQVSSPLRLVFVGSLIARKGLPTLLEAVRECRVAGLNVLLDVYGPGNIPESVGGGVEFRGPIPFGKAQKYLCKYDVMVLPSLHDGWGVVVNEALLQGVPVIVSDAVGAHTLVEKSGAGCVYRVGDVASLTRILTDLYHNTEVLDGWRQAALDFRTRLSPAVAARYLHECICFVEGSARHKPHVPWYQ